MLERVVVRDVYDQVIYEDVIDVRSEEDLEDIYTVSLRYNATVFRYPYKDNGD